MRSPALECEWHVSEEPTVRADDTEEERYAVHYMLDPGDGLCSTLIKELPADVAHYLVNLHNGTDAP